MLETMKDLQPISVYNIVYKLMSKVLANWLKMVLPSIIHETKSAFISHRIITNNAIIDFKIFHKMKLKHGVNGFMALKLEMSKAYDCVEWDFLITIMHKMHFP